MMSGVNGKFVTRPPVRLVSRQADCADLATTSSRGHTDNSRLLLHYLRKGDFSSSLLGGFF
jgi:hypothetical protein